MDALVSVIVPIYKVESYLEKCVHSIMHQTYDNLEIILVDDGSPDSCGLMCDDFATSDKRIRVIHQKNQGLSEARNHGIDICTGSYILLVDADDYIEPNTVEYLLQTSKDTCADVVCCGFYREYTDKSTTHLLTDVRESYEDEEILTAALQGTVFSEYAWNKLWNRTLFDDCKFPPGRYFEDIATTWKLFRRCHKVTCVPDVFYHYVIRKDSIGNTKNMKNFVDRWVAFKERFDMMAAESEELCRICTNGCLDTIGYTWRWLYIVDKKDRKRYDAVLQEMRKFVEANRSSIGRCSLATRVCLFCALHSSSVAEFGCYYLNQMYRRLRGWNQMV